ncbi:MAG TPA: hypothetical protein DEO36_04840 [Flavobacteriaceae bacterium]|nr:hypothetical protein [Flavobacteriaceae bacterium]
MSSSCLFVVMNKPTYLILFLALIIVSNIQGQRITINGKVKSNIEELENIHVINKSSNKGTITNTKGEFKLSVKEKDTLIFSGIQFNNKEIIINPFDVLSKSLTINMISKRNQLDEVTIRKSKNIAVELGLPNAGKKKLTKLEAREVYYSQAPVAIVILSTLFNPAGNFEDLYHIISGNRKRDRKLKAYIEADKLAAYNKKVIKQIRLYFKDVFFTETLQIPEKEIEYFIEYCLPKGIIDLYIKKRNLEIMDIFIKESITYLKELKDEE